MNPMAMAGVVRFPKLQWGRTQLRNVSMILRQSDGQISVDPPELIEGRVEED